MTTQPHNPQENVELLINKMRVLWLGGLGSLLGFIVLTFFTPRSENAEPNDTLFLILVVVGLTATLASFVVKKRFFAKAEEQQQVHLVQQGFMVAMTITEVAALLGVLDYFSTGDRYYYVLFIITACGQLLHYPRREPFLHATFKSSTVI
jgi:cellobiose-specific phosphotransferase system component IIC